MTTLKERQVKRFDEMSYLAAFFMKAANSRGNWRRLAADWRLVSISLFPGQVRFSNLIWTKKGWTELNWAHSY